MPKCCSVCAHRHRLKIDRALAIGESCRRISAQFGVSPSALQRHRQHVKQAIIKASEQNKLSVGQTVLERLEGLYQRATRILSDAESQQDGRLALSALREVREMLGAIWMLTSKGTQTPSAEIIKVEVIGIGKPEGYPDYAQPLPSREGR